MDFACPKSVKWLYQYPKGKVQILVGSGSQAAAERRHRLRAVLAGGVVGYGDYSGYDCPREAVRLHLDALAEELGPGISLPHFTMVRACPRVVSCMKPGYPVVTLPRGRCYFFLQFLLSASHCTLFAQDCIHEAVGCCKWGVKGGMMVK